MPWYGWCVLWLSFGIPHFLTSCWYLLIPTGFPFVQSLITQAPEPLWQAHSTKPTGTSARFSLRQPLLSCIGNFSQSRAFWAHQVKNKHPSLHLGAHITHQMYFLAHGGNCRAQPGKGFPVSPHVDPASLKAVLLTPSSLARIRGKWHSC